MNSPEHPLLPHLVDLESRYVEERERPYDPSDLVRYALATGSHYWADLALAWVEQGATDATAITDDLERFERDRTKPQASRHRAKALRKAR